MKRSGNSTLYSFIILLTAALSACKKEEKTLVTTVTPTFDRSLVHALMAPLRSAPQTFTVNAGTLVEVEGVKGTKLTFYPNSFKNAAGDTIRNGPVEIRLLEMYSLGDMIANRASTLAGPNPLKSGGQIYITARQGGQEVFTTGYGIRFRQPAASTQSMNIYFGNRNNADSLVLWNIEPIGLSASSTRMDSISNTYYYQFDSVVKFNFVNCDHDIFKGSTIPRTTITTFIPEKTFTPANTTVWIVYPGVNAIGYMDGYTYTSYNANYEAKFSASNIPVGEKFHVIMISILDNKWHYAELRNQTMDQNHMLALTPSPSTWAEILTKLSTL